MSNPRLLIIVATVAFQLVPSGARAGELPHDELETYLKGMSKQVTTLRATFQIAENGRAARQVQLAWDRGGDRVRATVVHPTDEKNPRPQMRTWVRSSGREWEAFPEYDPEHPGTWIVDLGKPGQTGVPEQINRGEFGTQFLSEALSPYHLRDPDALAKLPDNYTLKAENGRDPNGRLVRTYTGYLDGRLYDRLTYTVDDSDGLRVLNSTYQETTDGKLVTYFNGDYSEHQKVNGVWVPKRITERRFGPDGKPGGETTVAFDKVEVNVGLDDKEFVYNPPHGSRVKDRLSGVTYRAGYNDPFAPLGRDTDPVQVNAGILAAGLVPARDVVPGSAGGTPDSAQATSPVKARLPAEKPVVAAAPALAARGGGGWTWWALAAGAVVVIAVALRLALRRKGVGA